MKTGFSNSNPGEKRVPLQSGQEELDNSHVSMQLIWKAWEQSGSSLSLSTGANSDKHTAQSKGSLRPTISLYWKTGRDSIKDWSNPESWRLNRFCNCLSGLYLFDVVTEIGDLFLIRNLISRCRRPAMKNIKANRMIIKRRIGLILGDDGGGGGTGEEREGGNWGGERIWGLCLIWVSIRGIFR